MNNKHADILKKSNWINFIKRNSLKSRTIEYVHLISYKNPSWQTQGMRLEKFIKYEMEARDKQWIEALGEDEKVIEVSSNPNRSIKPIYRNELRKEVLEKMKL